MKSIIVNTFNKFGPILILVFGIIICSFIWDYITFPYNQENTIIGEYSEKKFNPLNDSIRGIFFIFFPLLLYLFTLIKVKKVKLDINFFKNLSKPENNRNINFLIYILILFSILEFLNLDFKNFISELDTHHEGTSLTAQLNLFKKDGLWTQTFYDYGLLGNNIGILSNYIFNDYTIGIQRFTFTFLILINKIFLILICSQLIKNVDLEKNKNILFFVFTLFTLSLADFNEHITPFHARIFIFLIFTFVLFKTINSDKSLSIIYLFVGMFSLLSILFYYDIGTYINILLAFSLFYLFFIRQYLKIVQIILGIIISWLIFFWILPTDELSELKKQFYIILNISDYLLGIEYPKPFSENSTRYTKALLLIILSGVFLINFIFSKKNKENRILKFYLLFLFISSIIFFKSGLMRSDTPHIKYTSGIYTLLIFFFVSYHVFKFFNKFKYSDKLDLLLNKKRYLISMVIIVSFFVFFKNNFSNLINLNNTNKNFLALTKVHDDNFLANEYLEFVEIFRQIVKNEKCIQQFTDDNAIPYLVNKPTCTKFYVNAHIIDNWTDKDFIKELKSSNTNYILYSSKINWFKNRNNAKNANNYIVENYSLFKRVSVWEIYKKN